MRTLANIVMKRGLFYAADSIDRKGKPHVADDAPGFTSRGAAEEWANRDKTPKEAPVAEEASAEERESAVPTPEGTNALGDPLTDEEKAEAENSGDVTIEVPTGTAVAEGQTPEVTVEQP